MKKKLYYFSILLKVFIRLHLESHMLKFLLIPFLSKMKQSEEKTLRMKRPSDTPILLYTVPTVPRNKKMLKCEV